MNRDPPEADWQVADEYSALMHCDRRAFAWEWLRRTTRYRRLWAIRDRLPAHAPTRVGLLTWIDPSTTAPEARPIWTPATDPKVLRTRAGSQKNAPGDTVDILALADYLSVAIDEAHAEHWLFSDGRWLIRLMHRDGTLLGRSAILEHEISGLNSAVPKIAALRQLVALAEHGEMPASLHPRETRAARWILELRTADALAAGASQKMIAQGLFGKTVTPCRWRVENASYRSRVQRLVKTAQRYLADPFSGPWFR
ncbi:DNA -binding domain-containing protein [Sphingopyxis panaciterrulae]|uniref:DUF2285 domain-containing protein n=1 Tax=Sphingopyxis panaciterrulae TaxID=462372 RepID=A0A7W9ER65_9SPHN|nr:DUF2285 domain-containing protein [Sphingopyxis panaciterrulae]MBB5707353.1 hypothetical protein [Sphingopyxis panaciterrulae]